MLGSRLFNTTDVTLEWAFTDTTGLHATEKIKMFLRISQPSFTWLESRVIFKGWKAESLCYVLCVMSEIYGCLPYREGQTIDAVGWGHPACLKWQLKAKTFVRRLLTFLSFLLLKKRGFTLLIWSVIVSFNTVLKQETYSISSANSCLITASLIEAHLIKVCKATL